MAIAGLGPDCRAGDLSPSQVSKVNQIMSSWEDPLGSKLKRQEKDAISKLVNMGTYRGIRLKKGYPVRGQRTKTNATTAMKLRRTTRT